MYTQFREKKTVMFSAEMKDPLIKGVPHDPVRQVDGLRAYSIYVQLAGKKEQSVREGFIQARNRFSVRSID